MVNLMLRKTFEIQGSTGENDVLYLEIGQKHITCFTKPKGQVMLSALEFFQFKSFENKPDVFLQLMEEVRTKSQILSGGQKVECIVWSHKESICIPNKFFNVEAADAYLNVLFGENAHASIISLRRNEVTLVGRIPRQILQALEVNLANTPVVPQYGMFLNNADSLAPGSEIRMVFYPDFFLLSVWQNEALVFIQNKECTTPEDALYFVMNVCRQYEIDVKSTGLFISGMIDSKSPLYDILYKYFESVTLDRADEKSFTSEEFYEHPMHYFSHYEKYTLP